MATATQPLGAQASLGDWMKYADDLRRTKQYEPLGKGKVIVLEAAAGVEAPGAAETSRVGLRLEWTNRARPSGVGTMEFFMPLAQSRDRRLLLALAPFQDENGRPGLPKIPDPEWKRPAFSQADYERINTPLKPEEMTAQQRQQWEASGGQAKFYPTWESNAEPPLIEQPLERRYRGYVNGFPHLWVFGPIHQILFQPDLPDRGLQATYWTIEGKTPGPEGMSTFDPGTRTHLELVIDMNSGWGYFFGGWGAWDIRRPRGER